MMVNCASINEATSHDYRSRTRGEKSPERAQQHDTLEKELPHQSGDLTP